MFDILRRDGDASNTVIGIILLVMLLVFVGPNVLPSVLSRTFPFIDEGVPCTRLRTAEDRGRHQSLIGRSSTNPLSIRTEVDPLPSDAAGTWTVRVTLVNNTIGTVPFVFAENQVIVGDTGTSGVGLIFTPQTNVTIPGNARPTTTAFADSNIRLLGPRQLCVHRVQIPTNQVLGAVQPGNTTVTSYYRIASPGQVTSPNAIYPDQGLNVIPGGRITSEPVVIPVPATAN